MDMPEEREQTDEEVRASLNKLSEVLHEHGVIGDGPDSLTEEYRQKRKIWASQWN
jgi:hypothetical protein